METALVSRLTQDIQDLRQDKDYLRADVARLQAELDRERAEKERYRRRLEELLGSTGAVDTVPKSPLLEIIGFTEPPSELIKGFKLIEPMFQPPHSVGDVDEPREVDYESHDPNFAHLANGHVQDELDRPDNALGKRKVSYGFTTPHPSSKKPRTSPQPSESGTPPSPPLPLTSQFDALGGPSTLNATSSVQQQHAPPIPPLPYRQRANTGVGTTVAPAVPVPPLPFRPRPVRNFKIKEEEAVTLPVDIVANYLRDVPPFSINPDPSGVPFVSRKFLAKVYGGSDRQFLQYIDVPASSPSSPTAPTRRRKPLMFPTPEMNPSMPLFPGDPGLIFTSRTEILKNGPWTVFRKYDRGIDVEIKRETENSNDDRKANSKGKGKQKSVVWVYLGDYECTKVGRISREEWVAQNDEVKKRWVNRVASKMTGCYLSMRARIGLRKAGIVPGSSTGETHEDGVGAGDSTNPSSAEDSSSTSPPHQDQSDEDPDERYERLLQKEVSAHRSCKPHHPITERDILEALNRGEEGVDIVQLKCVAYDWEWVRDFEGRWDKGERGKWWEVAGRTDKGRDRAYVKTKRVKTRSTVSATNGRARSQSQVERDVGAGEISTANGPIDNHGEATMAPLSSQLPPLPTPSLPHNGSPTGSPSIATPALSGQASSQQGSLDPASRSGEMNVRTAGSSSEDDIDDGYLSYVSEAEGGGGLDVLSDLTDLEDGDDV
ncbi:hypothetical protein H1R20_g6790, partial [Candolleomyces eurysporus]